MKQEIRVLSLVPTHDESVKPSELIQISGHQELTLYARRAITILWHNAHRQGIEQGKRYVIELSALRPENNKSARPVEDAILLLMKTVLTVKLPNGRKRRVQFLGGNDMDDPGRVSGTLTYSFDQYLIEILSNSAIWGRIAIPVLMAFTSKYAVSLYENISQWTNLKKTFQDVSLEELRMMMGVEDSKYPAFGALNKHVMQPSIEEINALAAFNISLTPIKTSRKVTGVRIGWWRKSEEEMKEAFAEAQRPKFGRRARLSGRVEDTLEIATLDLDLTRVIES